jgi:hypothetical protein
MTLKVTIKLILDISFELKIEKTTKTRNIKFVKTLCLVYVFHMYYHNFIFSLTSLFMNRNE